MEKQPWHSIRQSQNPGIGKNIKGHLIQHGISFIELMDADMDTVISFPMTGSPFFTFPKNLISSDSSDRMFLLISSQNYLPITPPVRWYLVCSYRYSQSIFNRSLCSRYEGNEHVPPGHISQRLGIFSTSPIP